MTSCFVRSTRLCCWFLVSKICKLFAAFFSFLPHARVLIPQKDSHYMQFSHIHHTVAWKYHMILLLYNYDFNCAFFMFFGARLKIQKIFITTLWATSQTHTQLERWWRETRVVVVVIVLFVDVSCKHIPHVFFDACARVLSYIEAVSSRLYHFCLPGHTPNSPCETRG